MPVAAGVSQKRAFFRGSAFGFQLYGLLLSWERGDVGAFA